MRSSIIRPAGLSLTALLLGLSLGVTPAQAQVRSSVLVSPTAARQLGLERMWFTQLSTGGRGRVVGLNQHVSATQAHTVFQITFDGKRYVFSQLDRDAFGKELGVEGAQAEANSKLAEIQADLEAAAKITAEKSEPAPAAVLPAIETYVVPRITLYGTSQRGTLDAIDGETGKTRWSAVVGNSRYPTTAAGANDNYVALLNGSTLYVLKATDGSLVWSRMMSSAPGAGPALTDEYAYIPMLTGAVESYFLEEPKRPVAVFRSFGRTMVQPTVSVNSVAWPTDEGNLYVALAHEAGLRFRLEAKDSIESAPAFLAPERVFVTSLDGYVYSVQERRGNIVWRFTTGEPISHSPVALIDTVYAITDRGNMYAIDAEDGQERWLTSGIKRYVAGNESRLYVMDSRNNLTVLDRASGSRIGALMTDQIDVPFMNVVTDRVILATSTGMVQCLRQSDLHWPVVVNEAELARPAAPTTTPTPTPTPVPGAPLPMPAGADPFGADPFGAPGKPAPAPMPPAGAEPDPFGAPAAPAAADPFAP
jgi:outer membrane protein assembly factor BamB